MMMNWELQKSHIRIAVVLRAILAVVAKWLIGVLIGKILKSALDLEDVFDQASAADPLYDVILLNDLDFHTVVWIATIEIVMNVIMASCVSSMGSLWAVKEGRRWRRQVLDSALGLNAITNRTVEVQDGASSGKANDLLSNIQVIEAFIAFDQHSLLFNQIRLVLCISLSFVFTWYAGLITIIMTILSEIASKLFERMRSHLHASIEENQSLLDYRLVDVIKNHITVKILGTATQEKKTLQELEQQSDEQRKRDAIIKTFRDTTKLIFTSLVPILLTLIAWPIVTNSQQSLDSRVNAATALFVTMLLLDEVHKSLISLSFVHDRQVSFLDAENALRVAFGSVNLDSHDENLSETSDSTESTQDKEGSVSGATLIIHDDLVDEPDLERAVLPNLNVVPDSISTKAFTRTADPHAEAISLDDLVFQYAPRQPSSSSSSSEQQQQPPPPPVLYHYCNSFQKGKIHGLVGESGSGKSTTLKIVANLLSAETGKVQICWNDSDNQNSKRIAYVSQDQTLFHRTLRENITYGMADGVSDEEIWEALEMANLDEWVRESLPRQLEEVLDEKCVSGGQLQRIHLAHLFCCHRDAECVLLDECLSALDEKCRESLIDRLQAFLKGKTTILITHHTEMLRICHQIHDMSTSSGVRTTAVAPSSTTSSCLEEASA